MKKIISILLAAVLLVSSVLMLSSCSKKGEKFEISKDDIDSVFISPEPDFVKKGAILDKEAFVDAFNSAEVGNTFDDTDGIPGTTVILFIMKDKTIVQAFYQGDSEFIISSTKIEKPYRITSSDLEAELYHKNLGTPEFVKLDASKVTGVTITPDRPQYAAEPDVAVLTDAYNKGTLTNAFDPYTESVDIVVTAVFMTDDGILTVNYLGEDEYTVTGSLVKVPYRMTCPELKDAIYAVKEPVKTDIEITDDLDLHIVKDGTDYEGEADTVAIAEAYNSAEAGKALDETFTLPTENIIIIITNGAITTLYVTGENEFVVVSGGDNPPYTVTSSELYQIFTNLK